MSIRQAKMGWSACLGIDGNLMDIIEFIEMFDIEQNVLKWYAHIAALTWLKLKIIMKSNQR